MFYQDSQCLTRATIIEGIFVLKYRNLVDFTIHLSRSTTKQQVYEQTLMPTRLQISAVLSGHKLMLVEGTAWKRLAILAAC